MVDSETSVYVSVFDCTVLKKQSPRPIGQEYLGTQFQVTEVKVLSTLGIHEAPAALSTDQARSRVVAAPRAGKGKRLWPPLSNSKTSTHRLWLLLHASILSLLFNFLTSLPSLWSQLECLRDESTAHSEWKMRKTRKIGDIKEKMKADTLIFSEYSLI